jgi:hypothetical protein
VTGGGLHSGQLADGRGVWQARVAMTEGQVVVDGFLDVKIQVGPAQLELAQALADVIDQRQLAGAGVLIQQTFQLLDAAPALAAQVLLLQRV